MRLTITTAACHVHAIAFVYITFSASCVVIVYVLFVCCLLDASLRVVFVLLDVIDFCLRACIVVALLASGVRAPQS
jgi:hypothetical protein